MIQSQWNHHVLPNEAYARKGITNTSTQTFLYQVHLSIISIHSLQYNNSHGYIKWVTIYFTYKIFQFLSNYVKIFNANIIFGISYEPRSYSYWLYEASFLFRSLTTGQELGMERSQVSTVLVLHSVTSQRELYQSYIISFSYILCQVARCNAVPVLLKMFPIKEKDTRDF